MAEGKLPAPAPAPALASTPAPEAIAALPIEPQSATKHIAEAVAALAQENPDTIQGEATETESQAGGPGAGNVPISAPQPGKVTETAEAAQVIKTTESNEKKPLRKKPYVMAEAAAKARADRERRQEGQLQWALVALQQLRRVHELNLQQSKRLARQASVDVQLLADDDGDARMEVNRPYNALILLRLPNAEGGAAMGLPDVTTVQLDSIPTAVGAYGVELGAQVGKTADARRVRVARVNVASASRTRTIELGIPAQAWLPASERVTLVSHEASDDHSVYVLPISLTAYEEGELDLRYRASMLVPSAKGVYRAEGVSASDWPFTVYRAGATEDVTMEPQVALYARSVVAAPVS